MIEATVTAWANELGKDPDTIRRGFSRNGLKAPEKREKVRGRDVFNAVTDPEDDPKRRLLTAQAIEQERLNLEATGTVVQFSEVEKLITEFVLAPLSQALLDAKATGKARPEFVDELMKRIVAGLPKVK